MRVCQKCGSPFSNSILVDGKRKNLQNRKFCLICSPYGLHNTKTLNSKIKPREGALLSCKRCGRDWEYHRAQGATKSYCPACYMRVRSNRMKKKAVEYKGSKCVLCGYDKFIGALEFHHIDPSDKEFFIGQRYCLSWEKMVKELDKCILVCSCCHAEIHGGLYDDKILSEFLGVWPSPVKAQV